MKQKRNTVILIVSLILIVSAGYLIRYFFFNKDGTTAIITQNGKVIQELSLNDPCEIKIDDGYDGTNTIIVKNHTIYISEANCPDLICVKTDPISSTGGVIACLPHGLIITIEGSDTIDSAAW